jgi:hypothetical protein
VIPFETIEEYYPKPFNMTKTDVISESKVKYALKAAESISFDDFKNSMPVVYNMLEKAIEKGYE